MRKSTVFYSCLIFFLICVSCKSNIPTSSISIAKPSNQDWRKDKLFDPVWYDTLQSQKRMMFNSWLNDFNPIGAFSGPQYSDSYNLFSSKEDWGKSIQIPVEIFTLNGNDFRNAQINKNIPFESLLKLSKDKAEFFVVKDLKFYYNVSMSLNNNNWKSDGYGPIFKNFADTLSNLYFTKQIKIFRVYIPRAFDGRPFTVYKKDGMIFCIIYGGASRLFEEELRKLMY